MGWDFLCRSPHSPTRKAKILTNAKQGQQKNSAILLIHCPDREGLVASVTDFIHKNHGNILFLDQHVDAEKKVFFMRVEWELAKFKISRENLAQDIQKSVAQKFNMQWKLYFSDEAPRMAVFVSKQAHCLYDILARQQTGEWQVEVPLIVSNHADLEPVAKHFGIDYHVIPIKPDNKKNQEQRELELLKKYKIDFVVLARYMQILTGEFIRHYPNQIINIHHSFLPAFPGSRPYHSAYDRGVKVIGASSHYITEELDAGPIIEQDVVHVSHKDSVADLIRKGQDLEKVVLARSVWYHLQRQILVYENRTVNFA